MFLRFWSPHSNELPRSKLRGIRPKEEEAMEPQQAAGYRLTLWGTDENRCSIGTTMGKNFMIIANSTDKESIEIEL
jgi:hypothetical protein